ncbi:hypothetical protein EVAR_20204_1 [Eumeta japonica]|uniref:Uncharacterized protein n=1 Tax=Eumeta variegata TaxID=151549 RepID=A0A4C1UVQ1_EUMVA|nr:hypothetical protein EVAR_20204_1 [Eumeta japonica]
MRLADEEISMLREFVELRFINSVHDNRLYDVLLFGWCLSGGLCVKDDEESKICTRQLILRSPMHRFETTSGSQSPLKTPGLRAELAFFLFLVFPVANTVLWVVLGEKKITPRVEGGHPYIKFAAWGPVTMARNILGCRTVGMVRSQKKTPSPKKANFFSAPKKTATRTNQGWTVMLDNYQLDSAAFAPLAHLYRAVARVIGSSFSVGDVTADGSLER